MDTKFFEIRDRGTFIPALAIRMVADEGDDAGKYLLGRAGFVSTIHDGDGFVSTIHDDHEYASVILIHLDNINAAADPYDWTSARTMRAAHLHIQDNWEGLVNGQVVDVQVLLKETTEPAVSERF